MKVISLKEPWASLIKEKRKCIETRSWKTNYRGEIYIHASLAKVNLKDEKIKDLVSLLNDRDFKYGYIICKANLVDCVCMDEEWINKVKENEIEYKCGEYSVSRYGWILEDIQVLDEPIKAKGSLGLWNYK